MFSYSYPHKICDPIHGFIRFDTLEWELINSCAFQRLRYIRQMGVTYLVYPGAQHTRFEHSLGVMEMATRIYQTLVNTLDRSILEGVHSADIPKEEKDFLYWKRILRMAALCHDLGHLPFSHTAEKELLPDGGHEKMTLACIRSPELQKIWAKLGPQAAEHVLKLAVKEKELKELDSRLTLTSWERMLSQVITDDNFGADRIDYLIRDAQATGVGYGHFDYHQLIDSLRILPGIKKQSSLTIGIAESGIQSVESLWMARYLMYARVYFLISTRLHTFHMSRFMKYYYDKKGLPITLDGYLQQMDFTILNALIEAKKEKNEHALILLKEQAEFKEVSISEKQAQTLSKSHPDQIWIEDLSTQKSLERLFSVLTKDKKVLSSAEFSSFLKEIPLVPEREKKIYVSATLGIF